MIQNHYPLLKHNTLGINAFAKYFVEYTCEADLVKFLRMNEYEDESLLAIGSGSNLLFCEDYEGVVLHSAIHGIEVEVDKPTEVLLRVGAGELWDDFVNYCIERGLGGAENLSLIPGEVGASAVQNIGAYGSEVQQLIMYVEAIEIATAQKRIFRGKDCQYAYRQSIFKGELKGQYIITYVTFCLQKQPQLQLSYGGLKTALQERGVTPEYLEELLLTPEGRITALRKIREIVIQIRQDKLPDPALIGNAGSFFMNPIIPRSIYDLLRLKFTDMPHYPVSEHEVKVPAGWLIDRCGWKGKSIGRAGVHDKQALVLVNLGGATAQDIIALADAIIQSVRNTFTIELKPEVNYISLAQKK